jgi:predicted acetyltransferase
MTFSSKELTLRLTETHPASDELPPWQYFDIIDNATGDLAGKISARLGDNKYIYYNGHVGFEIDLAMRGYGYAAKAVRLLLPLAGGHGTLLYI